jgi:hypothetical protein
MKSSMMVTVAVTVLITLMLADRLRQLPLVKQLPTI